jgi:hypothetical protein
MSKNVKKLKTKGNGWINAYYENKLDNLPLGYIKKVESLFTEMNIKMCEPQESNRLDGGNKYKNFKKEGKPCLKQLLL